ncbi:MAG: TlpA disulfide reductase family protein [Planctomycetota bacterium]
MTSTSPPGNRRTLWTAIILVVLVGGAFAAKAIVRAHVDSLIQHAVDQPLPAFALADRDGRTWTNQDLAGKRALLHFFRSFCGSCDAEAPAIRALEQALPADVVLLHVMTDRVLGFDAAKTAATIAHDGFARPILMADAAFADALHGVKWSQVTPITYVVDARGVVRFGLRGMQTQASIEAALAAIR